MNVPNAFDLDALWASQDISDVPSESGSEYSLMTSPNFDSDTESRSTMPDILTNNPHGFCSSATMYDLSLNIGAFDNAVHDPFACQTVPREIVQSNNPFRKGCPLLIYSTNESRFHCAPTGGSARQRISDSRRWWVHSQCCKHQRVQKGCRC
jgi:hypothetical protein